MASNPPSFYPETYLMRVSEAESPAQLHALASTIKLAGEALAFSIALGMAARVFDADLLLRALSTAEGADHLARNTHLDSETRERLLAEIADRMIQRTLKPTHHSPGISRHYEKVERDALIAATQRGLISHNGPAAERLRRSIAEDAQHLLARFGLLPYSQLKVLLSIPTLPEEEVYHAAQHISYRNGKTPWAQNNVEDIVKHPSASTRVWIEVLTHDRSINILTVLAHKPALASLAVRSQLRSASKRYPDATRLDVLKALCGQTEGNEFRDAWIELRTLEPSLAAHVLHRSGRHRLAAIQPDDLAPLFASSDAAIREMALSALAKLNSNRENSRLARRSSR